MDEEVQDDLRSNKNFNTYKGAIYENIVGDMLVKQGYQLYFYRNEKGTLEMGFFVRDADWLILVEVKANDASTVSLKFYTFPYFLAFFAKEVFEGKKKLTVI